MSGILRVDCCGEIIFHGETDDLEGSCGVDVPEELKSCRVGFGLFARTLEQKKRRKKG